MIENFSSEEFCHKIMFFFFFSYNLYFKVKLNLWLVERRKSEALYLDICLLIIMFD